MDLLINNFPAYSSITLVLITITLTLVINNVSITVHGCY